MTPNENVYDMAVLFDQLGLDSSPREIDAFIAKHKPLSLAIALANAPFWSLSQSHFLTEKLQSDDNWSLLIDFLNARLRARSYCINTPPNHFH